MGETYADPTYKTVRRLRRLHHGLQEEFFSDRLRALKAYLSELPVTTTDVTVYEKRALREVLQVCTGEQDVPITWEALYKEAKVLEESLASDANSVGRLLSTTVRNTIDVCLALAESKKLV
jgi:hypothetical protein